MTSHKVPSQSPYTPAPPVPRLLLQEATSLCQRAPCIGMTVDEALRRCCGIERIETAVRQGRRRNHDRMHCSA